MAQAAVRKQDPVRVQAGGEALREAGDAGDGETQSGVSVSDLRLLPHDVAVETGGAAGEAGSATGVVRAMSRASANNARYKIRPSDVIYILQSPDTDAAVAQRLGVSRQAVNNVRLGRAYRRVAPQLPRRTSTAQPPRMADVDTCVQCNHWHGYGCAFGFPEALKDLAFAQECSMRQLDLDVQRRGAVAYEGAFDDDATA